MHKFLLLVPATGEIILAAVLFQVGVNYVAIRRVQIAGKTKQLQKFDSRVEAISTGIICLLSLSVLALAAVLR